MNDAQMEILRLATELAVYERRHRADGMLISEEAGRLVRRHPVVGRLLIITTGLIVTTHLADIVSERHDVLSRRFWAHALGEAWT